MRTDGCWIFISHSSKDIEKIRMIRNEFEKYGQNREEYKTITKNDCNEFVSHSEAFKQVFELEIAKDPFNKYIKIWMNNMVNEKFMIFDLIQKEVMDFEKKAVGYLPFDSEYYYADALCNALWKWIAEDYENGDSTDSNQVFEILLDYFKPGPNLLNALKSLDDRRAALRNQCRSCALYDSCDSKRENCPSWTPRSKY